MNPALAAEGFISPLPTFFGHLFGRPLEALALRQGAAKHAAEKTCFVSGHDFSRAIPTRLMRALAPEIKSFPCLLAEGWIPVESLSFALPDRCGAR